MPITNPSPELREAIRRDGMCRQTGAVARWGFHPEATPTLFILSGGEALPDGWYDTPANFPTHTEAPATEAETPSPSVQAPAQKKRKG